MRFGPCSPVCGPTKIFTAPASTKRSHQIGGQHRGRSATHVSARSAAGRCAGSRCRRRGRSGGRSGRARRSATPNGAAVLPRQVADEDQRRLGWASRYSRRTLSTVRTRWSVPQRRQARLGSAVDVVPRQVVGALDRELDAARAAARARAARPRASGARARPARPGRGRCPPAVAAPRRAAAPGPGAARRAAGVAARAARPAAASAVRRPAAGIAATPRGSSALATWMKICGPRRARLACAGACRPGAGGGRPCAGCTARRRRRCSPSSMAPPLRARDHVVDREVASACRSTGRSRRRGRTPRGG